MTIEYDQQELVNEYIAKQNRKIANLTAENIMLETRLEMAEKKLTNLMSEESEVMDAGTFEEEPQEEEK
jgi:cell division protein FtsB|tara:strand:- start:219 stop:425 length:207 start_codon:yes stop_codon:yes gene_type:complete